METLKDTQDSRKGESLLDTFGSFLVIGVYSEINSITGFLLIYRLRVWSLLVTLDYGALIRVH